MTSVVGRAILPAAAFEAAVSEHARVVARCDAPAESRRQPGWAAPQVQLTLTATVTPAGLLAAPTCTVTGTAAPAGMPNGICTCTAVTPGALAAVLPTMDAGWPSMVTDNAPARNCESTPFTNSVSTLPWAAGCDAPF